MAKETQGVDDDLRELAKILADWSQQAANSFTLFLYGSRARQDHQPDSDVDIHVKWHAPDNDGVTWWGSNNEDLFQSINNRLPGRLQILEPTDPLSNTIESAEVIYSDRNAHVFLDKEYHVEGSRLQRFAWFRRKQELHFVHHRHANTNFAVIHFFWDRILGTYRRSKPA